MLFACCLKKQNTVLVEEAVFIEARNLPCSLGGRTGQGDDLGALERALRFMDWVPLRC